MTEAAIHPIMACYFIADAARRKRLIVISLITFLGSSA